MSKPDHIAAHDFSFAHRSAIETSDLCGCFYCLQIFPPSEIVEWTHEFEDKRPDEAHPPGVTAICPKCGIDSVIGSASGYPITEDFLRRMQDHWF